MLQTLRQKPEHQKRKIAVVTSIVITAIIFVFWISSTIHSFSVLDAEPGEVTVAPESPFSVVKDNVASVYESVSGDMSRIKEQFLRE